MCDLLLTHIGKGTQRIEETATNEGETDVIIIFDYSHIYIYVISILLYVELKVSEISLGFSLKSPHCIYIIYVKTTRKRKK